MDLVIDWRKYETEFMGEPVSMELRPLKRWAWFELAPLLENHNPKKEDETAQEYIARLTEDERKKMSHDSEKLQELSAKIFPEHVKNIQGITVNGEVPTWEQISEEIIFLNLCVDICGQLAEVSTLTKTDEKNSEGLPASPTSASDETKS